jgi:hypothetical protein
MKKFFQNLWDDKIVLATVAVGWILLFIANYYRFSPVCCGSGADMPRFFSSTLIGRGLVGFSMVLTFPALFGGYLLGFNIIVDNLLCKLLTNYCCADVEMVEYILALVGMFSIQFGIFYTLGKLIKKLTT